MSRTVSALVALSVMSAATDASATEPLTTVPMDPYVRLLRTVMVRVGNVEMPFLLDTGGGVTCITPELARAAGCDPYGLSSGFRLTGERVDFRECGEMTLSIGGVALDMDVTVFDMHSLLEGLSPVGGLISVHTFADQPFTIDLAENSSCWSHRRASSNERRRWRS